jgi:hypothetical protein
VELGSPERQPAPEAAILGQQSGVAGHAVAQVGEQDHRVFDRVPPGDDRGQPEPGVARGGTEQGEDGDQDADVPEEVSPLQVELPDDAARLGRGAVEQVDLDHLGDVFAQVPQLHGDERREREEEAEGAHRLQEGEP